MTPSAAIETHAAIRYLYADRRLSDRVKRFTDASALDGLSILVWSSRWGSSWPLSSSPPW
jgi:hypothetical protein